MCKVNLNQELNGIEISFAAKPEGATLEALKANGFRWSPKNKLWYAKQTAERVQFAQTLGALEAPTAKAADYINMDNLGVKPENFSFYGAELAKCVREDLKKRGVKGYTVRSSAGVTSSITITVKATADDFCSLEEAAERYTKSQFVCDVNSNCGLYVNGRYLYYEEYSQMSEEDQEAEYYKYLEESILKINSINVYHSDNRNYYWEFTTAFYTKLCNIIKIANQWNYDNSDIMTDYFDKGYYLDVDIKKPENMQTRATMTEEERKAYQEEKRQEEEEREARFKAQQEEEARQKEAAEKYNKWVNEATERIYNSISIEDLDESEQYFIKDIIGGIGKENSLQELKESLEPLRPQSALITRKVIFEDKEALEDFNKLYLHDFDFLTGKGGTASEDVRLNNYEEYCKLTADQRESITFYLNDSIAVYYDNELQIVIDPEGYSYSRYVYIPTENTTTAPAEAEKENLKRESEDKAPFYIPEPLEIQAKNLQEGQEITLYYCDGWLLNTSVCCGILSGFYIGPYAQYKDCLHLEIINGRKTYKISLKPHSSALIYEGIHTKLPAEVTGEKISENMTRLYNHDEMLPHLYKYLEQQGQKPIIDNWQR